MIKKTIHSILFMLFVWRAVCVNAQALELVNIFEHSSKSEIAIKTKEKGSMSPSTFFDGESSYIEVDCESSLSKKMTFCAWIRPEDLQVKNMTIAGIPGVYWFRTTTGRELQLTEPDVANYTTEGALLTSCNWCFVSCIIDYPNVNIYQNAKLISSFKLTKELKDWGRFIWIGRDDWQHDFHGSMHQIGIYKEVLSEEVLADMYIQGLKNQSLTDELIMYYRLDNNKAQLADKKIRVNNNGVVFKPDSVYGTVGSFNGENSFIDFGPMPVDNAMTISAWVKPASLSLNKGAIVSLGHACAFRIADEGNLLFTIPQLGDFMESSVKLKENVWQQVGVTFKEGIGVTFYLNGQQLGVFYTDKYINAQKDLRVGNNLWNNYFHGEVADLIIWNRILSPEEMKQVYEKDDAFWTAELKSSSKAWLYVFIGLSCVLIVVGVLIMNKKRMHNKTKLQRDELDDFSLDRYITVVNDNLSDSHFSVEHFANALHVSKTKLYNELKALSGHSPKEFVREQRLSAAAQLLEYSKSSITEILYETGFESRAYFNKCFKAKFGMTPTEYRLKQ